MNSLLSKFADLPRIIPSTKQVLQVFDFTRLNCRRVSQILPIFGPQFRMLSHGPPLTKPMIEDRILLVLRLYDKIDGKKLSLQSNLKNDFGLDSLDLVEVVMAMEEEFTFEIPDAEAQRFVTPRDIAEYICDKHDIYH